MFRLFAAIAVSACIAATAGAQSLVSTGPSFVSARLIPGHVAEDGTRTAGLELTMAPGWKTYWRSPGEAGIPPRFDWSGSDNLREAEVLWPVPETFESFGYTTIGYSGRVVLPVRMRPADPSAPMALVLGVDLGVCRDICVFERVDLRAALPRDLVSGAGLVAAAEAAQPPTAAEAGVRVEECRIEGAGGERRFRAVLLGAALAEPHVVLEGPEGTWFQDTAVSATAGRIEVTATLSLPEDRRWIGRGDIRLTLLGAGIAVDIPRCGLGTG